MDTELDLSHRRWDDLARFALAAAVAAFAFCVAALIIIASVVFLPAPVGALVGVFGGSVTFGLILAGANTLIFP